eukprot:2042809-Pleurochrysis_carterae.AAC.2
MADRIHKVVQSFSRLRPRSSHAAAARVHVESRAMLLAHARYWRARARLKSAKVGVGVLVAPEGGRVEPSDVGA